MEGDSECDAETISIEKFSEFAASMGAVLVEDDSDGMTEYGYTAPGPSDFRKGQLQILSAKMRSTALRNLVVKPGAETCCLNVESTFRMIYGARLMQFEQSMVIESIQATAIKTRVSIEFEAVDKIWRTVSEDGKEAVYTIFANSAPRLDVRQGARDWSLANSDFTAGSGQGPRGSRGGTQSADTMFVVYRFATAAGPKYGGETDADDSVECRAVRRLNAYDRRLREQLAETTTVEDALPQAGLSRERYQANVAALNVVPVQSPVTFMDTEGSAEGAAAVRSCEDALREFHDPNATYELPCPNCQQTIVIDLEGNSVLKSDRKVEHWRCKNISLVDAAAEEMKRLGCRERFDCMRSLYHGGKMRCREQLLRESALRMTPAPIPAPNPGPVPNPVNGGRGMDLEDLDSQSEDEGGTASSDSDSTTDSEDGGVLRGPRRVVRSPQLWSPEEDTRLAEAVGQIRPVDVGPHSKNIARAASWRAVAEVVGSGRSARGCTVRWAVVRNDALLLETAVTRAGANQ